MTTDKYLSRPTSVPVTQLASVAAGEQPELRDFFLGYSGPDSQWADWIAAVIEQDGKSVYNPGWNIRPGNNVILEIDKYTRMSKRTLLILSAATRSEGLTEAEWAVKFREDPDGAKRLLIPVRVEQVTFSGLLGNLRPIELAGLDETAARKRLLDGIYDGRASNGPAAFPG